jgi:hypothetical protein
MFKRTRGLRAVAVIVRHAFDSTRGTIDAPIGKFAVPDEP